MGEVYRAKDEVLGRDVALKFLLPALSSDEAGRKRLVREARTASSLNHPNICTIYEVGEADDMTYIAMEYLKGRTLSSIVRGERLTADDVYRYGLQIADALAYAHAHGVVHRDLKSANVVVTKEGYVKVLDFGLAKRRANSDTGETLSETLTEQGSIVGTIQYMAPEVLRGAEADARVDVWALGVILYEMSTGNLPFDGRTQFEITSAILRDRPTRLPIELPSPLHTVIARCLAKDPEERYQSAEQLKSIPNRVLGSFAAGESFGRCATGIPGRRHDGNSDHRSGQDGSAQTSDRSKFGDAVQAFRQATPSNRGAVARRCSGHRIGYACGQPIASHRAVDRALYQQQSLGAGIRSRSDGCLELAERHSSGHRA